MPKWLRAKLIPSLQITTVVSSTSTTDRSHIAAGFFEPECLPHRTVVTANNRPCYIACLQAAEKGRRGGELGDGTISTHRQRLLRLGGNLLQAPATAFRGNGIETGQSISKDASWQQDV